MMLSLSSVLLAASIVSALPQLPETYDSGGIYPATLRANYTQPATSPTPTLTPLAAPSSSAGFDQARLDSLWAKVEAGLPVLPLPFNTVQPVNKSFFVPETPLRPTSLQDHAPNYTFPKGFLYGVAGAAQQVEGAVKADGRGPSHWDYLCHVFPTQCTNYTSDVTDLFYYTYKQDIARIKAMGVNAFSFSISWTRIYPFGKGPVNEAGLKFYSDLVDELLANGITPVATLFHWDTPLELVLEYGGFLNNSMVNEFVTYAETVFKRLGDRVETWFTFNEPRVYCSEYTGLPFTEVYPAGINSTTAPYPCTYNVLLAHGKTVQMYRQLVKDGTIKSGEIAFKNDDSHPIPYDSSNSADQEASDRHFAFYIGIFSEPVYGDGNYPDVVLNTIPASILPRFTAEQRDMIKGSADFYAIDGYRTNVAKAAANGISTCAANITDPNWPVCQDGNITAQYTTVGGYAIGPPADPNTVWLYNTAPLLREQLKSLLKSFPSPKIYLSEFGLAREFEYDRTELYQITYDSDRAAYYLDYLTECLKAIHEDGIPLAGTFAWSFVDNFEWGSGLEQRFGMQYVNASSPTLERTYKLSFLVMRDFMAKHLTGSKH